ncbi:DUF4403 family protein [Erythrobacter sp. THAF29]|uniref:DUF4403 family protein n=1 Tax=Erythrobacter sp. THAF29 TaxID=2587851 RepID=UPI0012694B18|nr:DUF4403 family protein [Erythrobacter sp. THAF29]QFT78243.1 hypothetical protein FIU90_11900 [Erythrobacter sp. THAF29]
MGNSQPVFAFMSRLIALMSVLAFTSCSLFEQEVEPPPRADDKIEIPEGLSSLSTTIEVPLDPMRRALEREIPRRLYTISKSQADCIPSQRTEVIGIAIRSPTIRCDLTGQVNRGSLSLRGSGRDLIVTMPIRAEVKGSEIGGIIKQETATARANVTARVRLSVRKDWSMRGDVDISYSWRQPPTVEILGQKLTFADGADERLRSVVSKLERTVEREIAKLDLRGKIAPVWERGFTVLSLNAENPPVWMRLTPRALGYDGYYASRNALSVAMRLDAKTEIFVGDEPEAPGADYLPAMAEGGNGQGGKLALALPVIAQYSVLEPVIERALAKRAERVFKVPAIGDRMIEVQSVSAYCTEGNRIAVGVEFKAWKPGEENDPATGTVWLTAKPVNDANSRKVRFVEPEYQVETTRFTTNVIIEIAKTRDFSSTIEDALTQNFEDDYEDLLAKVDRAIAETELGDFSIATDIDRVSTGSLTAYGEGLFLPVSADGETQIRYAPR